MLLKDFFWDQKTINSPSYNLVPRGEGINGINTLSAHDSSLESCLNPDWQRTTPVTLGFHSAVKLSMTLGDKGLKRGG